MLRPLSTDELAARGRARSDAKVHEAEERKRVAEETAARRAIEAERTAAASAPRPSAARAKKKPAIRPRNSPAAAARRPPAAALAAKSASPTPAKPPSPGRRAPPSRREEEEERPASTLRGRVKAKAAPDPKAVRKPEDDRGRRRLTTANALDETERNRSLAAMRRRT